jgi:hydrogenase-4 membrane subunit HyfE
MPGQLLDQFAVAMSYLLIIIALGISATRTLKLMVPLYQIQALVLTSVVLITAFEPGHSLLALGLLAILPLALAVMVPPLLARATLDATKMRSGEYNAAAGQLRP